MIRNTNENKKRIDPEPQGGPQSVCLALAAICFSENAKHLWTKRGLEKPGVEPM